ncbi:hypothetical protein PCANC_00078 [Puccinia coronata f. sp. avenae]|uniref:Amino acid permease/ SLC12A domain-containing protein n=1 Tax=Puccinia coronata f. sp. avenae TaxID=200324 RepID=A0A2N5W8Q1_9BASI|nr:hypothetical protein PCANC_00078 [Puccinia coronata f. sp. avenae]
MTTKPPPKYEPNKVGDNSATVDIDVFPNTDEEEKAKDETCSHGSMDGASRVVQRQLKQRHISMIAMAGTIGSGLFLGSGQALRHGGPVGTLLGYSLMGIVVFSMQVSLGEMVTMFPVTGAIPYYAERFVDPAMGFAVGVNICCAATVALAAEITAAAILIQYWDITTPAWIYISIFLFSICAINLFGVKWYGEAEFVFSSIKLLVIVLLIILGIVLDFGGGPNHDRIGFRYWVHPGPFTQLHDIAGPTGRFLGFWTVFIQAAYSYQGIESVAIMAGEAENPRKSIPKAIKRIFFRISIFYIGGVAVAGLLVPSNSPQLASARGHETAQASPFVIAINSGGIRILPDIVNAAILISAYSTGNTALYCGSRVLHGLASRGMAPSLFTRCTQSGIPILALIPTAAGGLLAFLRLNNSGETVFRWLTRISAVTGLFTWLSVLISYLRFYHAMKHQGIDRNKIPYKSPLQPYLAYFGLLMIAMVILFNGFEVFLKDNCSVSAKLFSIFRPGTKQFELMDEYFKKTAQPPRSWLGRFWDWLM